MSRFRCHQPEAASQNHTHPAPDTKTQGRSSLWGEEDSGGHVMGGTTSRGVCGPGCPSCTSEREGKGDCVKGGGGDEGGRVKERAWGMRLCHIYLRPNLSATLRLHMRAHERNITTGRRESDFALQATIEGRAAKAENVQVVALRWHSSGSEVRLGLLVGLWKKKSQKAQKFALHAG